MARSVFEKHFYLGASECDLNGVWKPSSLLEALQNTSNEHSSKLKIWHNDLDSKGVYWVLFKTDIQIDSYPMLGETVKVQTYVKSPVTKFCPRYFIIKNKDDETIARAGSLLMLIDRSTHESVDPKAKGVEVPDDSGLEPSVRISMRRPVVEGKRKTREHVPNYSDLDINGHVNNTKYVEWLCNTLGPDVLKERELAFVSCLYMNELLPDETAEMDLTLNDDEYRFAVCGDGGKKLEIYGKLRKRERYYVPGDGNNGCC